MAKERSADSTWPSRYSPGGWVRVDQYIIELLCEKQARKKGADLPVKFWNLPEWASEFRSQLRATKRLLKKYSSKAILNVIKERNIWSLRPKWVEQVIQKEQEKLDKSKDTNDTLMAFVASQFAPTISDQNPVVQPSREQYPSSTTANLSALDE